MPKPYPSEFRCRSLSLLASGRSVRDVARIAGGSRNRAYTGGNPTDLLDHGLKFPTPEAVESAALAAVRARIVELEHFQQLMIKFSAVVAPHSKNPTRSHRESRSTDVISILPLAGFTALRRDGTISVEIVGHYSE